MVKNNKYQDWSKEDLIKELDSLNKRKKYGLVWEDKPEDVVEQCKKELPVLAEVLSRKIHSSNNDPINLLIEGDNYHALSVLNYTHKNKVDLIYIDPPYNTGNKSWKYNNNYVDKEDSFRHSKWISFMFKRLELAKKLLSPTGVIIVTVDDYEIFNLGQIMDEAFGESNRLGTLTIMHNPRGRSDDKFFATSHEYALFYAKSSVKAKILKLDLTEEQAQAFNLEDDISRYRLLPLRRTGSNSRPEDRPNLFYPIYFNLATKAVSVEKTNNTKNLVKIIPKDTSGNKRVWRWGKKSFTERAKTEIVVKKVNGKYTVYAKDRIKSGRRPKTVWLDSKYDASSHGTILLKNILKRRGAFDYPKSIHALLDTLQITVGNKKDAIILDFFAGSGTTGHATLLLNQHDGGERKFILCTNNENGIAREVCYPRISKVINGYTTPKKKKIKGLGGNLKYFTTAFVNSASTDDSKLNLTQKASEMLCIKEDTYDLVKSTKKFKIFNGDSKYTGIIYDQLAIPDFKKEASKLKGEISVYIFSLGDDTFEEEFKDMRDRVTLFPIPESILRVYRRIFK